MIEKKKYDVAVILINFNSNIYTTNCLNSILEKTSKKIDYQIIVVDNCSERDDFEKLSNSIELINNSNIQLIRSDINTGFGAGNMIGFQHSNADYLAFVNNDSLLMNDCLFIIMNALKSNDYGICGPLCFKEDGSLLPTIDHFASPSKELFGRKFLEKINPNKYPKRKILYSEPKRAQFISGSFMMLKTEDFSKIGGFDTNIFLYYEETDLCKRLEKINKYAYLIPDAQFIHYHGISTPKSLEIKIELKISFLYIIKKHYGYFWHKFLIIYLQIQYLVKSLFKPKYFKIFKVLLTGAGLEQSLKQKQKIYF